MKNTKKKGFTIVELVIVIAVIAILAAVAIPTFSSVITKAKESKAMQAAKNAYTEYLATDDNAQHLSDNEFCIESDGFFFIVTKGEFSPKAVACDSSKTAMKIDATGKLVAGHTTAH